jgi:hypothetical protein
MKKSSIFGATAAVTAVLFVGASTAAFAAWIPASYDDVVHGDVESGVDTSNFTIDDSNASTAWETANPQSDTNNSNWDGHGQGQLYDPLTDTSYYYDGESPTTCEENTDGSDFLLRCSPEELMPGVFVHPEVRFFDADNSRRILWVIENRSDTDLDVGFIEQSYSQCDGNGFGETSAGWFGTDLTDEFDATDSSWFVQREEDSQDGQCGVEANAWQSTDTTTPADYTSMQTNLDSQEHSFVFTLPEGETYGLAFFYADFWIDDNNQPFEETVGNDYFDSRAAQFSAATAYADDNWTTWSDSLATGLDGTIDIINWNYDASELAETGFDSTGIALTGVALAAAGTAIAVRRRVRA